jgi:hypothetical protein
MAQEGTLTVDVVGNPTRTLSALLAQYGNRAEFRARIFGIGAFDFFAPPSPENILPRSLDGGDNYLPEHPAARATLGPDPFAIFMPIYLEKLRELIGCILSEQSGEIAIAGQDQTFVSRDGTTRLRWGEASVPQIETYFERFHRRAQAAVRTAGTALIDGDPEIHMRLFPERDALPGLERLADLFGISASINLGLDNRHDLVVYAKTGRRIRFEVRRLRRGRYSAVPISEDTARASPVDVRLLHIMLDVERHDARRLVRWETLFRMFDEPDTPGIGDLTAMISAISDAAGSSHGAFRLLLDRLIIDGGVSSGADTHITDAAIRSLVRAGVLEEGRLRTRRPPSQLVRYQLAGDYRWLRQRLMTVFQATPD